MVGVFACGGEERGDPDEVLTHVVARPVSRDQALSPPVSGSPSRALGASAGAGHERSPSFRQVASEPTLRRTAERWTGEEEEAKSRILEFRASLERDFRGLDVSASLKRREHRQLQEATKLEMMMQRHYQCSVDASRAPEKAAWTYGEQMDYFPPIQATAATLRMLEHERERAQQLQGSSESPGWRLSRQQSSSSRFPDRGDWVDNDLTLRDFGAKPREFMGPSERKFASRLDQRLYQISEERKLELAMQAEAHRRRRRENEVGHRLSSAEAAHRAQEHAKQAVSMGGYFSVPEKSKASDNQFDPDLKEFIIQPERAKSNAPNIIIGDCRRTSFWKPRKGPAGSSKRQSIAAEMLCPPCLRGKI